MSTRREPLQVILVGAGERARAWGRSIAELPSMRVVALVAREPASPSVDALSAALPGEAAARFSSLGGALEEFPEAAVVVALPPRAGLEAALAITAARRLGLVEAPLAAEAADVDPELPGAADVLVAHGWVTLPGPHTFAKMVDHHRARALVEVRGLPEEAGGDLDEVLVHALALVRLLLPTARVEAARAPDGGLLEVDFSDGEGASVGLRAFAQGQALAIRFDGPRQMPDWRWAPHVSPSLPPERRALLQLQTRAVRRNSAHGTEPSPAEAVETVRLGEGDSLRDAIAVMRLARDVKRALPLRLPVGRRRFAHSARLGRERPGDLLARLGLVGELPPAPPSPSLRLGLPPEPFELWPFRAGIKPVAFLTVRPEKEAETLAPFGEVHVERRERRVQVDAQDRWTDRRDLGEPRVELYISRVLELAGRAARLQADSDPTRALRELGRLMGYPDCCVEAFARQDERGNNSRNRYQGFARTVGGGAWHWELNNLFTVLVPFYPCSYLCPAALAWARAALAELRAAHAAIADELRARLAAPVLYFDHEHQLVLDGEFGDGKARYRGVRVAGEGRPELGAFAGALGLGDALSLDEGALHVEKGGRALFTLRRTDPALGFLAPFGG